ncbi:Retrovirus-related Pol polyprotein from transposon RE2 [Vitis vinifera]|uniref:Retrovirus-related Pol polyprotein from transposon RE2 n=1 Tax=Vitis vinifera TaxID=29760 RepID=A0A438JE97_VITVI|nr:Retrovirus-related Pol polyprotein from transposon RE2 [Vitis vinifera]
MSSHGPPRNYRGALEVDLKTCAKGTKLRVYSPYQGFCQICGIQGHTAKRCPSFQLVPVQSSTTSATPPANFATPWQPRAHYAANTTTNNPSWLLDSGASHHVTTDLNNLSLHAPYTGSDDVMIGDGTGLLISHTGSASLPSSTTTFTLNDVLYDLRTGAIILTGNTKDGVYEWPAAQLASSPILAFSHVKTTSSNWHHRLDYPQTYSTLQTMCVPWVLFISECLSLPRPSTSKLYVSRHVQFVESVFPYTSLHTTLPRPNSTTISTWIPPVLSVSTPTSSQQEAIIPSAASSQGLPLFETTSPPAAPFPHQASSAPNHLLNLPLQPSNPKSQSHLPLNTA